MEPLDQDDDDDEDMTVFEVNNRARKWNPGDYEGLPCYNNYSSR